MPTISSRKYQSSAAKLVIPFAAVFALLLAQCGNKESSTMTFTGVIDANTVRVSSQTAGLVTRLSCDEGTSAARDAELASIDAVKLGYQLEQSNATLNELDAQARSAQAQLRAATINRDNIKTRLDRYTALLATGAATQQSVDDLRAQLDAANEQLKSSTIALGAIADRKSQIGSGRRIVEKQVREANILSPIDGTVLVRYAEVGEFLLPGGPICEVADLREVWTRIHIAETQLPYVKLGQRVEVNVDGMPDKKFEGTVTWISDKSEFTPKTILTEETRTTLVYPAKVTIVNKDGVFKIGMPVTVIVPKAQ
jgi:HlyD family secretion protein